MNRFLLPFAALLLVSGKPLQDDEPARGAVWNVSLVTDNVPDLTDIDRYLFSITSQYSEPQDQAIAIWRWSQRMRKQTTNPLEEGHYVLDPIRLFANYGHCNCGIVSGVNNALWARMGWKGRYVQLGDHTVAEVSWDGGATWHMFDSSMSMYCFDDEGRVASTTQIEKNPRFYLENYAPECGTHPGGWRCASDRPVNYARTLANGVDSFKAPNDLQESGLHVRQGARTILNFRPGERYTRYFDNLDGKASDPRYYRPVRRNETDIEKQHGHRNIRANGVWVTSPDLRNPDASDRVYDQKGVTWSPKKSEPAVCGPGWVVWKVYAANVVTSAAVDARTRGQGVTISVSRNSGRNWEAVQKVAGEVRNLDLGEAPKGVTQYLVRVELEGRDSGLDALMIRTITQLNRAALPKLTRGTNRIQVRTGRPVETIVFRPPLRDGMHRKTAFGDRGIEVNPKPAFYKATLRAADKTAPGHVTWKIETPTPIEGAEYGGNVSVKSDRDRVAFLHSWDGEDFERDYEKKTGEMPWDLMALVEVKKGSVPEGAREAYFRYEFESPRSAGTYNAPGIQAAILTVHHRPKLKKASPLEVTYCWVEHRASGDVERTHTEVVSSAAHEYSLNVAGYRDPTMKWVRMNLRGHGPNGMAGRPGYSDRRDVGAAAEPVRAAYRWGKNLAAKATYVLKGRQSSRNPDAGGDLTDGLIAPPSDYVSLRYMPTIVMFERDVSPVVTLDLKNPQTVAAVRVFAGQPEPAPVGDTHFAYPETIVAEVSSDGRSFEPAGRAVWTQVFDPPANYVAWELDDAEQFASLPAGGRLHYGYRLIFEKPVRARYVRVRADAARGRNVLLSEIEVFDRVEVDTAVPADVVLPSIGRDR